MLAFLVENNMLIINKATEPKRTLPDRLRDSKPHSDDHSYINIRLNQAFLQTESTTSGNIHIVQVNAWTKSLQGLFLGTIFKHNPNIARL